MSRVLIVNHAHSAVCGIHDLGVRIAGCLRRSTELEVNHLDVADANGWRNAIAITESDVIIVNYRPDLMPWVPYVLNADVDPPVFAVLHQYEESTADARAGAILAEGFDRVLALDPLLEPADPRVHAVGRPIPETVEHTNEVTRSTTRIGSFGFAFPHKGFTSVASEVAALHSPAVYNLHMPEAYFNGAQGGSLYTPAILADIAGTFNGRPDIDLCHTAEHLAERELVKRLSMNDVNCLLYHPGQPDAGLSSALDYLIAARRPMLLSEASMFRHAYFDDQFPGMEITGTPLWPATRLSDVLAEYEIWRHWADELYAWHHGRLVADIERIVGAL